MNSFIILFALVAAAAASGYNRQGYGVNNYAHGYGTAHGLGYGHNAGYGHGYGYGAGYGHARGGYVRYFNDHSGNTVPTMGEDQNGDGVADKLDSNRDGKEDKHSDHYGYGHGYGYGAGYGHGSGYGHAGYGYGGHNAGYGYGVGYAPAAAH